MQGRARLARDAVGLPGLCSQAGQIFERDCPTLPSVGVSDFLCAWDGRDGELQRVNIESKCF